MIREVGRLALLGWLAAWNLSTVNANDVSGHSGKNFGGNVSETVVESKAAPEKISEGPTETSSAKAHMPSLRSSCATVPGLEGSDDFLAIVAAFEEQFNIPRGLLLAIATVESTRRALAVHNFRGSRYFSSLPEAINYVQQHEKTYSRSISIGYMQINWRVHKNKFSSLREAFSPYHNVRAAVEILLSLYRRFGSWEKAIGWYNPKGGKWNGVYFQKVRRHWICTTVPSPKLS